MAPTLLGLPSELIETVLVCSGSPRTVASIAQTCRTLRLLVYATPDSHLWRELFLITWDDPRPALKHYSLIDPRVDPTTWDWGVEYRKRVFGERWLKAWRRDACLEENNTDDDAVMDEEWYTTALSALSTVLNTLLTLQPFPSSPPIALQILTPVISSYSTGNIESGEGDRREHLTNAPPLPPLLIMLATGFSSLQESRSAARLARLVYGPHASRPLLDGGEAVTKRCSSMFRLIPTPSLPPQLIRTLFASHIIGGRGLPAYVPFQSGPLGDIFHRIICITGFVPIPPPLAPTSTTSSQTAVADAQLTAIHAEMLKHTENEHHESDAQPIHSELEGFPTPSQQHTDARILARRRVYDMRYLRGDRLWGPFRTVTRESLNLCYETGQGEVDGKRTRDKSRNRNPSIPDDDALGDHGAHRLGTLAWAIGVDIDPDDFDSTSNESDDHDEDWHDLAEISSEPFSSAEDMEIEPTGPEHPLISLILAPAATADAEYTTNHVPETLPRRSTRQSNPRPPPNRSVSPRQIKPQHLIPDYGYLASVRIVVEANLKELFGSEISDDADVAGPQVQAGGVSMFWEDEDEIMRATAGLLQPDSHSLRAESSSASTPSGTSADSSHVELVNILSHFHNLEVTRLGGSCGYWGGWIDRQQSVTRKVDGGLDTVASSSSYDIGTRKPRIVAQKNELEKLIEGACMAEDKRKGKEKDGKSSVPGDWEVGPEGELCEGWDWAGIAGIWRRCVCWMDYRELLFYNLDSTRFLTRNIQEACRIIPMEIQITEYRRSGLMPICSGDASNFFPSSRLPEGCIGMGYFRPPPVIHFSGSSIGSDRNSDDGRTVRGSVQLIGGGEVRWQLESTVPGALTPEWSSEAVQVGGLGSAIGMLGMWTGARHERSDPLGPFWAWKVA